MRNWLLGQPAGGAELRHTVGALPGEVRVLTAEVTVGGSFLVNGTAQVQVADDRTRAQVEHALDGLGDRGLIDASGAERIDHDGQRVAHADGVGELDLATLGQAGGDHVFGHPTSGVRGGTVHLGAVLAGR